MSRPRTGVMLAKPFERRHLDQMPSTVIVQPKLQGAHIKAVPTHDGYMLLSSTGLQKFSMPHIVDALNKAFPHWGEAPTLDGEAYCHGMSQQDIMSIFSRTKNLHADHGALAFHIFDMISGVGQNERLYRLKSLDLAPPLRLVESLAISQETLQESTAAFINNGYEGIIIRDPNASYLYGKRKCILKLKPGRTDDYTIIGGFEAISKIGEPKNMLGGLFLHDDKGNHFKSGAGCLTHEQRYGWWIRRFDLPGKIAHLKYNNLSDSGIPLEPILMEIKDAKQTSED